MKNFLKSFFSNEKSPEEQALAAQQTKHDVLVVGGYEMSENEDDESNGCAPRGCGGCGCG